MIMYLKRYSLEEFMNYILKKLILKTKKLFK